MYKRQTWHCVSSRSEEDISKIIPVGEAYDNGVCLDWFEETQNLSNASYKPIRDQILQMEHLKLAFALEFLDSCGIRRDNIKFLRTDAIILSTPKKKMQLAKNALVNVTRQTLNQPKRWLFPQKTVMESSAGEGQIFRVFDCELPAQEKNGILFNQIPRETPHVLPPVQVIREGEADVVQLALQLTREKRSFCLYGPPGCGKSFLTRKCLELLDDCTITARTHVACREFDSAQTLSRLKHRVQKGFFNSPLCVDEVFMCETALLLSLIHI